MKEVYYKVVRKNLTHHGYTYNKGLNVDPKPWTNQRYKEGGFYFTNLEHLPESFGRGDLLCQITVPEDARFCDFQTEYKADRIYVDEIYDLWSIEMLAELTKKGMNLHAEDDIIFRFACQRGSMDIAKWIYEQGEVDIHADGDHAFIWACLYGHLDIAKWLYSLDVMNVHFYDDWLLTNSKKEVSEWLATL